MCWSQIISETSSNWPLTSQNICFKLLNFDHLKISDEFEASDLDCQICHKGSNVFVIPCECDNF